MLHFPLAAAKLWVWLCCCCQQEAQAQMLQEKQQHQQLAGSLLEHAGRLSHKYYNLSDDYDALEHRCVQLAQASLPR
jgi:hypothetical protein